MLARALEGRQVSIVGQYGGIQYQKDVHCTKLKQLLPRDPSVGRNKDLIQFHSDYGLRTVAVADIRPFKRQKRKPVRAVADEDV